MPRIVKKPDIRRLEIMDAAEKLFEAQGYEKTTIESIIKYIGIAKGTFYYYFKSKEEILQALVNRTIAALESHYNSIIEQKDINAIEKLRLMIRGPKKKKIISNPALEVIHHSENRMLQEQLNIESVKVLAPLIAQVLSEGKEKKLFIRSISVEIIQLMLAGSEFVLDSGLFNWSAHKRAIFLKESQALFELLLGVKAGLLDFFSKEHEDES